MSTILRSAAMSLLSKTLQTFLSKYLSDVDVEGIALPSVYDGSGWGVRLSNVKLRDGVQLLEELPGKRTKKRKRRQTTVKTTADPTPDLEPPQSTSATTKTTTTDTNVNHHTKARKHNEKQTQDDELKEASLHFHREEADFRPCRSRTNSYDELEISMNYGENECTDPARPATPTQDSRSIFSCFTKGKKRKGPRNDSQQTDESQHDTPPVSFVEEAQFQRQFSTLDLEEEKASRFGDDDTSAAADGEEEAENDEFEEYEQTYRMCLGDNGSIGTLDVRLIDRELHVMIEDAVLTIECFPKPDMSDSTQEEDTGIMEGSTGRKSTDDNLSAVSSGTRGSKSAPPPPKAKKAATKAPLKRDTIGERILADNNLASAIASIPHLLLRDVRVRFVLREDPLPASSESDTIQPPGPEDTMVEIKIEFLSVTNGEDILSHFQYEHHEESQNADEEIEGKSVTLPLATITTPSSVGIPIDNNEYIVRHIRTGRGPDAGVSVQIFAPSPKLPSSLMRGSEDLIWARQRWISATKYHLLRLSGLDVRARIPLGTKKEAATYSWFYEYEDDGSDFDYDDTALDAMLYGFDAIAPGPRPSLPPLEPSMSRGETPVNGRSKDDRAASPFGNDLDAQPAMHPGSDRYTVDDNGIQSCKIPSTFHRISRGLLPGSCKNCSHLPSETCNRCWHGPKTIPEECALDNSMPMPGLTLHVTLRDPLEINVDKSSVDTLHLLKTLFTKKKVENGETEPEQVNGQETKNSLAAPQATPSTADDATRTTSQTSSSSTFFGFFSSRTKEPHEEKNPHDSFSEVMLPENIQVLGVLLENVILRVHVIQEDRPIEGLAFCYWSMFASCLTIDHQFLRAEDQHFQDLRFDIGYISMHEYCGVDRKRLVSLGIPFGTEDCADLPPPISAAASLVEDHSHNKTPWPSAASALMDIPPPHETLLYKDRTRHAIQMRFISLIHPFKKEEPARSLLNIRVGATDINLSWGFWKDMNEVRKQITWGILGKPDEAPKDHDDPENMSNASSQSRLESTSARLNAIMTYTVQADGGSIIVHPMVDLRFPLTSFSGERSTEAGVSIEAILNKFGVQYGEKSEKKDTAFFIIQLAALPESIRTRILFCVDDWKPLEKALEVKKESNPFKRTMAIHRGIQKMARLAEKDADGLKNTNSRAAAPRESSRRQQILSTILQLNDRELERLWALHQRNVQSKLADNSTVNGC